MHRRKRSFGFTLIELLVVISIISLLSTVILAGLKSARIKAVDARKTHLVREYVKALALFYDNNGRYPNAGDKKVCLGVGNPGNQCLDGINGPAEYNPSGIPEHVNNLLSTYIPGPPASLDQVMISGNNYGGIGYFCLLGDPTCSSAYGLYWVMGGANGMGCASGFVENSWTPAGVVPASNAVCAFTSDRSSLEPIAG